MEKTNTGAGKSIKWEQERNSYRQTKTPTSTPLHCLVGGEGKTGQPKWKSQVQPKKWGKGKVA